MKTPLLCSALLLVSLPAVANTYYIANSGNDSGAGTSASAPWRTIARLNIGLRNARPGDSFLLKRGDTFRDDFILCGSEYQARPGQTVASAPPVCSGAPGRPITIGSYGAGPNPYVDAADVITGKWTSIGGGAFQLHLPTGSPIPLKLYVDPTEKNGLQQQLLPVPNYVGSCSSTSVFNYLDMWDGAPGKGPTFQAGPTPLRGCAGSSSMTLSLAGSGTAVQGFNPGSTGVQNVQAGVAAFVPKLKGYGYPDYPGVWYVGGSAASGFIVYVNLADGSDPNAHTIEATHRNYGVLIEGTNFVTVQDLTLAHPFESCAVGAPFSDNDQVAGNLTFQRLHVFNCASMRADFLTPQHTHPGQFNSRGGIILRASGVANPPNLQSPAVLNNSVGTIDTYFGTDTVNAAGILLNGIDGGGTANHCVICDNYVSTTTSPGINLTINLAGSTPLRNNGGRVARNELTHNQSNIGFASIAGGMLDHNFVHESYGQGIQLGGNSTSVDGGTGGPTAGSQVIQANTLVNLGKSATLSLYNGIDCNSSSVLFSGFYEIGNTILNTWGAGATFEGRGAGGAGCTAPHFWNNVIDQHYNYFGNGAGSPTWTTATATPNNSNVLFLVNSLHTNFDFRNNFYRANDRQQVLVRTNNPSFTCSNWVANGPDRNSTCDGADPGFANPSAHDFRLRPNSPLRGAGKDRADIGASLSIDAGAPAPGRLGQSSEK